MQETGPHDTGGVNRFKYAGTSGRKETSGKATGGRMGAKVTHAGELAGGQVKNSGQVTACRALVGFSVRFD